MDPIPDLDSLRTHLDRLADRGLVVWLSPPGRGRMLTHGLLPPEKLEKVRSGLGLTGPVAAGSSGSTGSQHATECEDTDDDGDADDDADDDAAVGERVPARDRGSLLRRIEDLEAEVARLRDRLDLLEGRG
jgi:uncharacterized protein YceH (UPF0502 family)